MASVPPRTERRRVRPGSVERPVNGRLYRGTWMLVGLPLLVAAFSVARPTPLPRAFLPAFDGHATKQLASELVTDYPNRFPGSLGAADWFRGQLTPYGLPGGRLFPRPLATPPRRRRRDQPRLDRRPRADPARDRRRHTADGFRDAGRDRRSTDRGPDRPATGAGEHPAAARRPRFPVLAVRAGAVRRAGDRRGHAH